MLFHIFHSQKERRDFGGSDFIEMQYCKLEQDSEIEKIVSADAINYWKMCIRDRVLPAPFCMSPQKSFPNEKRSGVFYYSVPFFTISLLFCRHADTGQPSDPPRTKAFSTGLPNRLKPLHMPGWR